MRENKCSIELYTKFLIGSQKQYSGVELSRVSPKEMAHDAVSGWLSSKKLTPKLLWQESQKQVEIKEGYLVVDDTLLDKPYAKKIEPAKKQYSGKHHGVVNGINIVNLLWTHEEKISPVDYRIYFLEGDGKTKNDHAREMLNQANKRGFKPRYVLMDCWFTSVNNLKAIDAFGWKWVGEMKANRQVSLQKGTYQALSYLDWTDKPVQKVWMKAYGFVMVSKIVAPNGDIAYLATNDLSLQDAQTIKDHYAFRWNIETFHRGIKQCCGIERCYSTKQRSQRNHILCAFLAFLKLEFNRIVSAVSWYQQKWDIARPAVRAFLL